jgi:solute carrier family 50 protein (sugar transporter)
MLCSFYGSPLSVLALVLRSRNAESFDTLLSLTQGINCVLWLVYGIFIGDGYIWGPNSLGFLVAVMQLFCIYIWPRKQHTFSSATSRHAISNVTSDDYADDETLDIEVVQIVQNN